MVNDLALLAEVRSAAAHLALVRANLAREARDKNTGLTSAYHAQTLQRLAKAIRELTLAAQNIEWPNGKPGASDEGA